MSPAEVATLVDFRRRFRSLTWDQLGLLFGVTGVEAREQWLEHIRSRARKNPSQRKRPHPEWWIAAADLAANGSTFLETARALGRSRWGVRHALREMGVRT